MISEAIILAGGLGTRLRSAVPDLPKSMAPVAGRPFLFHVIRYYQKQGIKKFVFSLGYRHEVIEEYLNSNHSSLNYSCSVEDEPLGTGGAILKASSLVTTPDVLVLNGDTFFAADIPALSNFHWTKKSLCTLVLKPMTNTDRYGVVETSTDGRITSFREKKWYAHSNINGGVYALNIPEFSDIQLPQVFSFEKDYLEKYYESEMMFGMVQDKYFIDIGIPEDFERAQTELAIER